MRLTSFLVYDHNLRLNLDLKGLDFDGNVLEKNVLLGLDGRLEVNCNLRPGASLSRDVLLSLAIPLNLRLPHLLSQLVHPRSDDLALLHKLPQLAIESLEGALTWATARVEDLSYLGCGVPSASKAAGTMAEGPGRACAQRAHGTIRICSIFSHVVSRKRHAVCDVIGGTEAELVGIAISLVDIGQRYPIWEAWRVRARPPVL